MKPLLPIIGLLLAGATTLAAQPAKDFQAGSASIRGQVTDPSGKSIPDAIVSLTNGQGASRGVKSDVQGQYELRNVDPGTYTVRASAKGFAPAERPDYQVANGPAQVLDFPLALASATERVTVQDSLQLEVDPSIMPARWFSAAKNWMPSPTTGTI